MCKFFYYVNLFYLIPFWKILSCDTPSFFEVKNKPNYFLPVPDTEGESFLLKCI